MGVFSVKKINKKMIVALCFSMVLSFTVMNFSNMSTVVFAASSESQAKSEIDALKAKGYSESDVQSAGAIAFASNNSISTVAGKKTKSNTWKDVQKIFNVSDAAYNQALKNIKSMKK